jgi:hypothetical protein
MEGETFGINFQNLSGLLNLSNHIISPLLMDRGIPLQTYPFKEDGKKGATRDQKLVVEEVRSIGPAFQDVAERLRRYSKAELGRIANEIIARGNVPKLGRLAPRYRASMICWFCRWAPDFGEEAPPPTRKPDPAPDPAPEPIEEPTQVADLPALLTTGGVAEDEQWANIDWDAYDSYPF